MRMMPLEEHGSVEYVFCLLDIGQTRKRARRDGIIATVEGVTI
jgi:hypothetical protein